MLPPRGYTCPVLAGMTGLLALVLALDTREAAPNAQLGALNPHIDEVVNGASIALAMQRAVLPSSRSGHAAQQGLCGRTPVAECSFIGDASHEARPAETTRKQKASDTSTLAFFRQGLSRTSVAAMHLNLVAMGAGALFTIYTCPTSIPCHSNP